MTNKTAALPNLTDLAPEKESVPTVICRVCLNHFDGWEAYADHVEAEHTDDAHRMAWVGNARRDMAEQEARSAATAEQERVVLVTKQQRLADMRAKIKERAEKQRATVLARRAELQRRRMTPRNRGCGGNGKTRFRSWLAWLLGEDQKPKNNKPENGTGAVVASPTDPQGVRMLCLSSPEEAIARLNSKDKWDTAAARSAVNMTGAVEGTGEDVGADKADSTFGRGVPGETVRNNGTAKTARPAKNNRKQAQKHLGGTA